MALLSSACQLCSNMCTSLVANVSQYLLHHGMELQRLIAAGLRASYHEVWKYSQRTRKEKRLLKYCRAAPHGASAVDVSWAEAYWENCFGCLQGTWEAKERELRAALALRYSTNPKTGSQHDTKSSGALHPLTSSIVKVRQLLHLQWR